MIGYSTRTPDCEEEEEEEEFGVGRWRRNKRKRRYSGFEGEREVGGKFWGGS